MWKITFKDKTSSCLIKVLFAYIFILQINIDKIIFSYSKGYFKNQESLTSPFKHHMGETAI